MNLLEVHSLKVAYGGIQAVKGISFNIAPGELVALIGSNGAGKTTMLKAMAGLLPLGAGTVHYCNQSIQNLAPHVRMQVVSMCIASTNIPPKLHSANSPRPHA